MDSELSGIGWDHTTTIRHYECWRCRKAFYVESIGGTCPDLHTPGECCHFGETEMVTENYDYAGAWISNMTGSPTL